MPCWCSPFKTTNRQLLPPIDLFKRKNLQHFEKAVYRCCCCCNMIRRCSIVILSVVIVGCLLVDATSSGPRHRRHQHGGRSRTTTVATPMATDEEKLNATETSKNMLQTSPKDALIVTKKRFLRKDWCQSQPLIQRIGQDQCLSATVLNRFCYGQCNSFFIPKNQLRNDDVTDQQVARGQGDEAAGAVLSGSGIAATAKAFRSCAVCQPKKTSWVTVTLKCPSLVPNIRRRRVLIINQCRCMQPESSS